MNVNKIIITVGIILAIFITFIFIQFNPFTNVATQNSSSQGKPAATARINNQTYYIYVARTEEEKQRGLSGRESLPTDEGMLFIFDTRDRHSFWMKEMNFPIDIIFIDGDTIVSISENAQPPADNADTGDLQVYSPTEPADKALEVNAGLAKKHNLKPGDKVQIKLQ